MNYSYEIQKFSNFETLNPKSETLNPKSETFFTFARPNWFNKPYLLN